MGTNNGEDHGRAKLTDHQVRQLRALWRNRETEQRQDELGRTYWRKRWDSVTLAARFGLTPTYVRRLLKGEYRVGA